VQSKSCLGGTAMSLKGCKHGTAPYTYTIQQFTEVIRAVASALPKGLEGTNPKEVIRAIQNKGEALGKALNKAINEMLCGSSSASYVIFVDFGISVEKLVRLGNYDWSNSDITSAHFPTRRTGKVETKVELIHLDRNISSDDTLKELDKMGYRPAEAHELLAFGAKYPDVQREFPIVALGSVLQDLYGYRDVVCLHDDDAERNADLCLFDHGWDGYWRFAAVRK